MPDPTRKPPVHPLLILALGILAISTGSILVRFAQDTAPSLVIAAWRLSLAAIFLAPFALSRRREELGSLQGKEVALAFFSGVFLALHFATWITSLEYTSVASSVVLVTTTPLWVALSAPFLLKEPLTRPVFLGMLLVLVGGVIIGLSDACAWHGGGLACPGIGEMLQREAFLGDLLALIGAWMAAAYVLIGRKLRRRLSLLSYITLVYGMGAIALGILIAVSKQSPFGYPPLTYLWFLLLALFPQLLGHSSFNWALRYVSAAYVSITMLGEPIGATLLAFFLLDEKPTIAKLFGAILILAGIYLASQSELKQSG